MPWDWHDWNDDPWSRGTWATATVGEPDLLTPEHFPPHGRVAFATSDIPASIEPGWIEGALVSVLRRRPGPSAWPRVDACGRGVDHLAHRPDEKELDMGEKTDQVKGKVKEETGRATDDERLEQEGKLDQAEGKVKEGARKVEEGVRKAL